MSDEPARREILVVDDSKSTGTMIRMVLEQSGFKVRVTESGRQAVEEVRASPPDLVICDILMPDLSGYEVVREIKADPRTQSIPVLLLSSMQTVDDRVRGLDTGADDYVTKPFVADELRARVRSHLRMKALQDELVGKNEALSQAQRLISDRLEALRAAYQKIADEELRHRHEMQMAAQVQRGLLPKVLPDVPGYSFHARFEPALEVAGDFYDVFWLADGRLVMVIGDVAGKGVPASLLMVLARTLVRTEAPAAGSPAELLERINRILIRDVGFTNAVTLFIAVLEPTIGRLAFANAGHEFPILAGAPAGGDRGEAARLVELCMGGPFLGVFPTARYNEGTISLRAGDRLFMFTDGLYHLTSRWGVVDSSERLAALVAQERTLDPEALARDLGVPDLGKVGAMPPQDDVTMLVVDCRSAPAREDHASLWIYNDPVNLREVMSVARAVARQAGLGEPAIQDLLTGLLEVATNAISHAYSCENAGRVGITLAGGAGRLVATVEDSGCGFEADRATESEEVAPTGRGLAMVRQLIDRLSIESAPGRGTKVVLEKRV